MDDLLNVNNNFFDSMVSHIYPKASELQLNKGNVSGTEASFLDLLVFLKFKVFIVPLGRTELLLCSTTGHFGFTFIYIGWFC